MHYSEVGAEVTTSRKLMYIKYKWILDIIQYSNNNLCFRALVLFFAFLWLLIYTGKWLTTLLALDIIVHQDNCFNIIFTKICLVFITEDQWLIVQTHIDTTINYFTYSLEFLWNNWHSNTVDGKLSVSSLKNWSVVDLQDIY